MMTELEELIAETWPEAYRIAYGILHDRGLAEDAAQETCVAIARKRETLNDPSSFRTWVCRIAANTAISIGRKRRPVHAIDMERVAEDCDPTVRLDVARALATLPLEQRALVVLHYYCGLSSAEISGTSGLTAPTVRFRLMLARRALRKLLTVTDTSLPAEERVSHG